MELRWPAAAAALAAAMSSPAFGADLETTREAIGLLSRFVALRSESADGEGVRRTAGWLEGELQRLGLATRLLEPQEGGNPMLFAQTPPPSGPDAPTVLFYMHFDTQPAGPPGDWRSTGGDPFAARLLSGRWDEPGTKPLDAAGLDRRHLPDARLYGRGAADDKAPIVMHLMALRDWLAAPRARALRIKLLLDGEEEAGSPHIGEILRRHAELLRADLLVLCDGPMDALERRSIYLGTRGDMHMKLTVRTAALPGHSGNYGLLPGAGWRMASLLASMKDRQGRVTIDGFEQGVVPPTASERAALREASAAEQAIAAALGTAAFDGDPAVAYYEKLLFHPTLALNHLTSGRPGNQVPVTAEAILEVRLVTRQDPRAVFEAVRRHVSEREPAASLELLDATPADRMDAEDPRVARGIRAARKAAGEDLLIYPTLGGTLPLLGEFSRAGFRYVGLPMVNFDNNQHVGNENVRAAALDEGIDLLLRLYRALEEAP
ncbi:MAG TPA: M20/M25/M40 family metallo-hydrolase [Candidatus Polarisedimenticolia bacterium]|nr:M20/M25/M40 family metallo-hydrolase [Candidatus Polarisedimenticolia bacterium]